MFKKRVETNLKTPIAPLIEVNEQQSVEPNEAVLVLSDAEIKRILSNLRFTHKRDTIRLMEMDPLKEPVGITITQERMHANKRIINTLEGALKVIETRKEKSE